MPGLVLSIKGVCSLVLHSCMQCLFMVEFHRWLRRGSAKRPSNARCCRVSCIGLQAVQDGNLDLPLLGVQDPMQWMDLAQDTLRRELLLAVTGHMGPGPMDREREKDN